MPECINTHTFTMEREFWSELKLLSEAQMIFLKGFHLIGSVPPVFDTLGCCQCCGCIYDKGNYSVFYTTVSDPETILG